MVEVDVDAVRVWVTPIIMEQLVLSLDLNMSGYSSRETIWLADTSKASPPVPVAIYSRKPSLEKPCSSVELYYLSSKSFNTGHGLLRRPFRPPHNDQVHPSL